MESAADFLEQQTTLQTVDFSELVLLDGKIPETILKHARSATSVKLSGKKVSFSNNPIFKLARLTNLVITHCNMETIPSEIFSVPLLVELNFSHNKIEQIHPNLSKMNSLRRINLSFNNIREWNMDEKSPLSQKLQVLNLSNNQFSTFPSAISTLTNLRELNLSTNNIAEIADDSFIKCKQLAILDLSITNISIVPDLSSCNELNLLNLSSCNLSEGFELRLKTLASHVEIHLENNLLNKFPIDVIREAGKSYSLYLQHNRIQEVVLLSNETAYLSKCKLLNLANNTISSFEAVEYLTICETLILSNNFLLDISPDIQNCKLLKSLAINGNNLAIIPPEIVSLPELEYLNVSSNRLKEFPDFTVFNKLIELRLDFNHLDSIPMTVYEQEALQLLSACNNHLTKLSNSLPSTVTCVQLDNNYLESVPIGWFKNDKCVIKIKNNPCSANQASSRLPKFSLIDNWESQVTMVGLANCTMCSCELNDDNISFIALNKKSTALLNNNDCNTTVQVIYPVCFEKDCRLELVQREEPLYCIRCKQNFNNDEEFTKHMSNSKKHGSKTNVQQR